MIAAGPRPKLLIVGAFPPPTLKVVGGMITNCDLLRTSRLANIYELVLVDSTQRSNPPPGRVRRALYSAAKFLDLFRKLRSERPQHALLFGSIGFSLVEKSVMAMLCRAHGATCAYFPLGGQIIDETLDRPWLAYWYRMLFAPADILLCQGSRWVEYFTRTLAIDSAKVAVVNSWTATPHLLDLGARRVQRDARLVRLVFVGWLEQQKGVLELLNVFSRLSREYDLELHLVGGGSLEDIVRRFARYNRLEDRVILRGWMEVGEVGKVLSESDIFVLPSWGEGVPNSLIEAMATKTPAVVTRVGSVPDFVDHGVNGILVEPRVEASLEAGIRKFLEDPGLRSRCAENGYLTAQRHFSLDQAVSQIQAAFET